MKTKQPLQELDEVALKVVTNLPHGVGNGGESPIDALDVAVPKPVGLLSTRQNSSTTYITLSQAARLVPGKTSPNALWRWCRRGVLARTGQRVHLQHVRLGGKLLTTRRWLDEFGERLADADKAYFDLATPEPAAAPPAQTRWSAPTPAKRRRARSDADLADHHARIAAELDAEGL